MEFTEFTIVLQKFSEVGYMRPLPLASLGKMAMGSVSAGPSVS